MKALGIITKSSTPDEIVSKDRQHFETSIYTYYIYAINSVLVYKNNIIIL
jgi:hypothetical protein